MSKSAKKAAKAATKAVAQDHAAVSKMEKELIALRKSIERQHAPARQDAISKPDPRGAIMPAYPKMEKSVKHAKFGNGTRVSGRESLGVINALEGAQSGDTILRFMINPAVFPGRLPRIADCFAKFRFNKMRLVAVTAMSSYFNGNYVAAVVADPTSVAPDFCGGSAALVSVQSTEGACDSYIGSNMSAEFSAFDIDKLFYCKPTEEDIQEWAQGVLELVWAVPPTSSTGEAYSGPFAQMYVDYDVEFYDQTVEDPFFGEAKSWSNDAWTYVAGESGTPSSSNFFGLLTEERDFQSGFDPLPFSTIEAPALVRNNWLEDEDPDVSSPITLLQLAAGTYEIVNLLFSTSSDFPTVPMTELVLSATDPTTGNALDGALSLIQGWISNTGINDQPAPPGTQTPILSRMLIEATQDIDLWATYANSAGDDVADVIESTMEVVLSIGEAIAPIASLFMAKDKFGSRRSKPKRKRFSYGVRVAPHAEHLERIRAIKARKLEKKRLQLESAAASSEEAAFVQVSAPTQSPAIKLDGQSVGNAMLKPTSQAPRR